MCYGEQDRHCLGSCAAQRVVARCSYAMAMMKLALITSLDHTNQAWKSVFMAVVVDDTQFQAVGPKNMVVRLVGGAARCFCEHAKEHAKLVLNMSKLEVVADDPQTANEVLKGLGVKARRKLCTRNLGVDYACGGKLGRGVQGKRLKKSLVRMPFLKRLRQAGARVARLVRSSLVPSLVWGSGVTGLPPRLLHQARRVAHAVCRLRAAGRSQDLGNLRWRARAPTQRTR